VKLASHSDSLNPGAEAAQGRVDAAEARSYHWSPYSVNRAGSLGRSETGTAIGTSEQNLMARKCRLVLICVLGTAAILATALCAAYLAARQVRPFYQQALQLNPEALERGKQELESRATALYTDARQEGAWQAQFTDEQVNGWLALQLAEFHAEDARNLQRDVRDPRIAILPDLLSLGFTTTRSGVDTVVSVDGSVFLTEDGDIAVRLVRVQAGALPLPIAMVADEIAAACQRMSLPVLWAENAGQPVAIIKVGSRDDSDGRRFAIDAIELKQGELFVAGHTDLNSTANNGVKLNDYELRLAPGNTDSTLEVARRPHPRSASRRAGR
jgi:hypothetical protein